MQLSIPTSRLGLGRAVKRAVHARAGFLSDAASQTATAAGLLGVSLSTLYLLRDVGRFEAGELQARPALPGVDAEEEDELGFIFSISTVLSLIPFLSWLAWVFPALNTRNPQRLYAFAAVYALPALFQAESLSSWYFITYALGALHFQVEALRATDLQRAAAALENLPSGSKAVAQLSETTAKQLTAFSEAFEYVLGEVEEKGKARVRLKEQVDNVKELQASKELQSAERDQWDTKLSKRLRDRD